MDRDKNLQSMLQKKETPQVSENIEQRTMSKIYQRASSKSGQRSYIRLIYLFFALGLILGFILSSSFMDNEMSLFGLNLAENSFLLQISLALVLIWLFEKIYRIILYQRRKEEAYDI